MTVNPLSIPGLDGVNSKEVDILDKVRSTTLLCALNIGVSFPSKPEFFTKEISVEGVGPDKSSFRQKYFWFFPYIYISEGVDTSARDRGDTCRFDRTRLCIEGWSFKNRTHLPEDKRENACK